MRFKKERLWRLGVIVCTGERWVLLWRTLFLCLHMWYTRTWVSNVLRTAGAATDWALHQERSYVHVKKAGWCGDSLAKACAQICRENLQFKNKCSLLSSEQLHRQQARVIFIPQEARRVRVGSLFNVASHIVKACLGTAPLYHTIGAQDLAVSRGLMASRVWEEE